MHQSLVTQLHLSLVTKNKVDEKMAWLELNANTLHSRLPYYPGNAVLPSAIRVLEERADDPLLSQHIAQLIDHLTKPEPMANSGEQEKNLKTAFQLDVTRIPSIDVEWSDATTPQHRLATVIDTTPIQLTLHRKSDWPSSRTPGSIHLAYVEAFLEGYFEILLAEAWRGGKVFYHDNDPSARVFGFTVIHDYVEQVQHGPVFPGVQEIRDQLGYDISNLRNFQQAIREAAHTLRAFVLGWEYRNSIQIPPDEPPVLKCKDARGVPFLARNPKRLFAPKYQLLERWCETFLNYKRSTY